MATSGSGRYLAGWRRRNRGILRDLRQWQAFGQASQADKAIWNDWVWAPVSTGVSVNLTGVSSSIGLGTPAPTYDEYSTLTSISATSYVAISDIMLVSSGTLGQISLNGLVNFQPTSLVDGTYNVGIIWRYIIPGGGWTDVPSEELSSVSGVSALVAFGNLDTLGEVNNTTILSGLVTNRAYEVQLYAKRESATPSNTIDFTGTVSANTVDNNVIVNAFGMGLSVARGSLSIARSSSLTGAGLGVSQGATTPALSKPLLGVGASIGIGSLSSTKGLGLTGQTVSIQSGAVTRASTVSVTGLSTPTAIGTITVGTGASVTLSGVPLAVGIGAVSVGAGGSVSLSGQAIAGNLGNLGVSKGVAVIGHSVLLSRGNVNISGNVVVNISGIPITVSLASLPSPGEGIFLGLQPIVRVYLGTIQIV